MDHSRTSSPMTAMRFLSLVSVLDDIPTRLGGLSDGGSMIIATWTGATRFAAPRMSGLRHSSARFQNRQATLVLSRFLAVHTHHPQRLQEQANKHL
jgi:hypothetical protein